MPQITIPASQSLLPDVFACSTVEDLENTLTALNYEDDLITKRLNSLLSMQDELTRSLSRLDFLRAHLGTQVVAARSLSNDMLSGTATTASRISSAVKALDIEQSRVKATLEVVEQVSELKACVLGVTGSMGAPQDWETAASYLNRASKIPEEIVKGSFAEAIVPTTEVPDPPSVTLYNAAESLCGLFLREFEKAASATPPDGEKITRYFKLFPLIGRSDVGLDVYGKYVCTGISQRARTTLAPGTETGAKGAFFYANTMTKLFEHIAGIVDQHSPSVERHYGKGRMGRVIMRIQIEGDQQGGIILDAWGEERQIDRKLTEIKSYAFSFLVQSFTRNVTGPQRTSSPAQGGPTTSLLNDADIIDIKEIDMLLLESGAMISSWSLYCRFMARKFTEIESSDSPTQGEIQKQEEKPLILPNVLSESLLLQKITSKLIHPFTTLLTFFIRRSVEKAFQLDEAPTDLYPIPPPPQIPSPTITTTNTTSGPFISSSVDDVMYIVNKVIHRVLHTSQTSLTQTILATISRVLSSDFIGMIQRKMRDEVYPKQMSSNLSLTIPTAPDERTIQFLILLNNLDISIEYLQRIIMSFLSVPSPSSSETIQSFIYGDDNSPPLSLSTLFPFTSDSKDIFNSLKSLETSFTTKASELLTDGTFVLFTQCIKPRLRPILIESFRDVDYTSETIQQQEDGGDTERGVTGHSVVKNRFVIPFTTLLHPYRYILTDKTYHKLLNTTASYLARLLEKKLWSYSPSITAGTGSTGTGTGMTGNTSQQIQQLSELGAIALERDMNGVISVVVSMGRYYSTREQFARVLGICEILGLEEDEFFELELETDKEEEGEGIDKEKNREKNLLTKEERRKVRGMVRKRD